MSHSKTDPVLEVRGLAVSAGGVRLVEGLELELRAGDMVGLVAPSGAGKTTLLRSVAGLVDPDAGEVRLRGRTPDEIGWPAFRRRVVLVEQQPVLLPGTVETSLRRPFEYRVALEAFPARRAEELLRQVGVGADRLGQDVGSLSVGQRQRVVLVRALLVSPAVLLLDEPTSALDVDAVGAVEGALRDAARAGCAILLATHDLDQAGRLGDPVIELAAPQPSWRVAPGAAARG